MKKVLKILGLGLAAIVVILIVTLVVINSSDIPSYEVETIAFEHKSSPEAIARGKKLSQMLCANCHMDMSTRKLTGKRMKDVPAEFGEIFSQNITQDETYGIGTWTDGELVYLLRTGIKRDGQYAPPYMAKLPHMADEDINAIIAFLRSDDRMVQAEQKADIPPKPSLLTKILCKVAFKPFPMPEETIPLPDTANTIELGKYLAHNLDCYSCHSADFKSNNYLDPPLSTGYFAGGNPTLDMEGRVKVTPNLTPDQETGIGSWSKEKFIQAVRFGQKEGEQALTYPMMPYIQLTEYEVGAIYDYLMTIPAINNKVERSIYN
ncbi:Cytochrome c [Ekhidna lutea]|uniref:Cytochrome c n=1 Tax=Ekhidna lutea TaxID=447679 RepID=A0A239LEL7_EKHLU|nr:c-type cytochrome [Ekhidna lutea]SNT28079.1 Cytochrome c [Ekhidna lutea]